MEKAPESCILCGHKERRKLVEIGGWSVYACQKCGLGVLDPRPGKMELAGLYAQAYFESNYGVPPKTNSKEMEKRLSQESHRIRFFRPFLKRGKILDIGCGMGFFLLACRKKGYEVKGIELSEDSASYCRDTLNINVVVGTLAEADMKEEPFDLITMWHFLEHTPDPSFCLERARSWLKAGGLIIVDVPNYESTDARLTWENWKGWQLPYHLYHFTPFTIKDLLKRHGFRILRTKSYLSEQVKDKIERLPLGRAYARLIARLFSGHSYAVLARKEP